MVTKIYNVATKNMLQKFLKHTITLNNKKFSYTLGPVDDKTTWVECKEAAINQPFLNEDIPGLLVDLPSLIVSEKEYQKKQEDVIRFRVNSDDKKAIEKKAIEKGYSTVSAFLRDLALGL